jgi:PAS domain S-box-containing protein
LSPELSARPGLEFFYALSEHATDLVAVLAADGTFRYASPSCGPILGYVPEALIGQDGFALIHPDDLASALAAFSRVLTSGREPVAATFRCRHADNSWRVLEATGTNRLADPVVRGIVINCRDVTERVQAEADRNALLAREQESLAALLEMAQALVLLDDEETPQDGAVTGSDAVAQRLLDLSRRALGCKRITITAIDETTSTLRAVAHIGLTPEEERSWRSGEPGTALRDAVTTTEREMLFGDALVVLNANTVTGRVLPFGAQTVLLALVRAGPRMVGVLALDHGATSHAFDEGELALARAAASLAGLVLERDRLLSERAEARAGALALRETNRRMDAFLALASHELKTPLTTVSGNVQIAERRLHRVMGGNDPHLSAVMTLLERAQRGVDRMTLLVNDLLDISRIEAGQLMVRRERCDLVTVVRDAVDEQLDLDPTRVLRLALPTAEVPIEGDPGRIGQVVINLLANALKYAPPDRPIEVSLRVEEMQARVGVRDEGPGLAPSVQKRVWERFYKAEEIRPQTGSSVGLGLGLYISKIIVEQHGGLVGVVSDPGQGSTFWFTLPVDSRSRSGQASGSDVPSP